jgi:hypothetical protein
LSSREQDGEGSRREFLFNYLATIFIFFVGVIMKFLNIIKFYYFQAVADITIENAKTKEKVIKILNYCVFSLEISIISCFFLMTFI